MPTSDFFINGVPVEDIDQQAHRLLHSEQASDTEKGMASTILELLDRLSGKLLPEGVVARIEIGESGLRVNLAQGMPTSEFAALLREIADAYDSGQMEQVG